MRASAVSLALATLAVPEGALAGRPLSVEDASLLEEKHCQLEAWADRSRVATDFWAVPACNFGANIEWQLGGANTREAGGNALTQAYAQAKTVLRPVGEQAWGVGLVGGVVRSPGRETKSGWDDPYVIVPVSFPLGRADQLLHVNVGWLRNRADGRNLTLWGVAAESRLPGTPLTVLAETFGENSRNPFFRVGGRYAAVEDRLDFDLSFVTRSGGTRAERFVSLGVYYKSLAFLP